MGFATCPYFHGKKGKKNLAEVDEMSAPHGVGEQSPFAASGDGSGRSNDL